MLNDVELRHLRRCVELATKALEEGDEPFGSVLVAADGTVLAEDHNRVASGDRTRLGPTMRSSRRRGTPPLFQAFVPGAADLSSLGSDGNSEA